MVEKQGLDISGIVKIKIQEIYGIGSERMESNNKRLWVKRKNSKNEIYITWSWL